jgi:hypothetical protein
MKKRLKDICSLLALVWLWTFFLLVLLLAIGFIVSSIGDILLYIGIFSVVGLLVFTLVSIGRIILHKVSDEENDRLKKEKQMVEFI